MPVDLERRSFARSRSEVSVHASSWQTPTNIPSLDDASVHVWLANIFLLEHCAASFDALIDADERARGSAFHSPLDRVRHLVTRGVLRALAGHYLDSPPTALRFKRGTFGKPAITSPDGAPLTFNVSHSGDVVLLAFARAGELGVDVERWNPRLGDAERARIAESVFSDTERATLESISSAALRQHAFYSLWSRKEAYLKGTGAGISGGLSHVDISMDEVARVVEDRRDARAVDRWTLCDLDVGPGYSAALASSPHGSAVTLLMPSTHLFDR